VHLSYAIGVAEPTSISVDCSGTEAVPEERIEAVVREGLPPHPGGIIEYLGLRRPIFEPASFHGHFGRAPGEPARATFSWESTHRAAELAAACGPRHRRHDPRRPRVGGARVRRGGRRLRRQLPGRVRWCRFAAFVEGRLVADLWGGEARPGIPWEPGTMRWCSRPPKAPPPSRSRPGRAGVIDLERPVCAYWPEFAARGKSVITLRHVLTHASGVIDFPGYEAVWRTPPGGTTSRPWPPPSPPPRRPGSRGRPTATTGSRSACCW